VPGQQPFPPAHGQVHRRLAGASREHGDAHFVGREVRRHSAVIRIGYIGPVAGRGRLVVGQHHIGAADAGGDQGLGRELRAVFVGEVLLVHAVLRSFGRPRPAGAPW